MICMYVRRQLCGIGFPLLTVCGVQTQVSRPPLKVPLPQQSSHWPKSEFFLYKYVIAEPLLQPLCFKGNCLSDFLVAMVSCVPRRLRHKGLLWFTLGGNLFYHCGEDMVASCSRCIYSEGAESDEWWCSACFLLFIQVWKLGWLFPSQSA